MNSIPLTGFDHCEFWVGNARQAAYYYCRAFGFRPLAYRGLETGNRETASYVIGQGKIRLVFSSPYSPDHAINSHLVKHGDGVRDVAFTTDDATTAFEQATRQGAVPVLTPTVSEDDQGRVVLAAIKTFGDTIHTFVERSDYRGVFLPGFVPLERGPKPEAEAGLVHIDHIVGNQPDGHMEAVVKWYEQVLGFHRFWTVDDQDISTEYSALRSVVVANENERIKMPINEPAPGLKKSQIQEYVDYYGDAGIQHLAFSTRDILSTVRTLRDRGVRFLDIPSTYYDELPERVGSIDEPLEAVRELGILVDRDDRGYLLQIFTEPLQDRPTVFFEIIQRKGSPSFGKGNFKALFLSIERAQARRGNL